MFVFAKTMAVSNLSTKLIRKREENQNPYPSAKSVTCENEDVNISFSLNYSNRQCIGEESLKLFHKMQ